MNFNTDLQVREPKPEVQLVGNDGNAFSIIARVRRALEREHDREYSEAVTKEMTSGDYNHLLCVAMETCEAF